ncbi:hypothetical protein QE152_g33116 [Popillia japonica]|uniref:Uncharacterized protein n=1 Tax=Popillia japonica TaxID=7064 RepID=A0AAW1IY33_POPJA
MILKRILSIYTITTLASASSYQYFRISKPNPPRLLKSSHATIKPGSGRPSRSFHHSLNVFEGNGNFLHDGLFFPIDDVDLSLVPAELTQFSHDDLTGYHDPLLLTGGAAEAAVRYIYGKGELFFGEYPHVQALLKNQEKRIRNGLAGNKLGSLRLNSPFQRYPLPIKYAAYV